MAKIIVQATNMAGIILDKARWEIDFPVGLSDSQQVAINIVLTDAPMIQYLIRHPSSDCLLDKNKDTYSLALSCRVTQIRHMIEVLSGKANSIAMIAPINRMVEHVLMYIYSVTQCNQQFVRAVRGSMASES